MTEHIGKILVIDDDEDVLLAVRLLLKPYCRTIHTEKDPRTLPVLLAEHGYDVILLDMNFEQNTGDGQEGFYWLDTILKTLPSAVVIFITAYGSIEKAVKAIKQGAFDFILKPWQNEKLLATVSAAIQFRRSRLEVNRLRSQQQLLGAALDQQFRDIIGNSAEMQEVYRIIHKVARTEANVLILGESGSGKELVARALHRQSHRANAVFVTVDVGAITETLFESELFGHLKGAFTDAKEARAGRFEIASGGSLFLDEIGNLPLPLQSKLLNVLQSREVIRLGGHKPIPIDIRLICATNLPPEQLVAEHKFRQDLFYRINTVTIQVPPLRQRIEDIPLLVKYFMGLYTSKYRKSLLKISPAALKHLQSYQWPGNVRELQHAIERAVILSEGEVLQSADFLFSAAPKSEIRKLTPENFHLETLEKSAIQKVLQEHGGNISRAAKELGLTRAALYRRIEKYGI